MKKKNLAIYALVGAMAMSPIFTSCVDSEETTSVTAIRNANAEQLQAIADLNNAKAASTTAMAAADAALINAKAEAQKAQKEYNEAKAAWYNTQDEEAKAALQVTIKQAEADLARIQGEIDKQAITIQATLLQAEYNLLVAQKDLENANKNFDEYQKAKLQGLAQEYADAVSQLIGYQQQLTAEKSKLVKLETGLMKAEDALEAKIAENNNQIALNNIQIEGYKQYVDYREDMDALYLEYREAYAAYSVAYNKRNVAQGAWNKAMNEVNYNAYYEAWDAINEDEFYNFVLWNSVEMEEDTWYWVWDISRYFNGNENYENIEHKYVAESGDEFTYPNWIGQTYSFEYELNADIRQLELEALNLTTPASNRIDVLTDDIQANETALTAAATATADAKTAWDNAADADKDAKKAEYEAALNTELGLKQSIENDKQELENLTKYIASIEKALDMAKNAETLNAALQEKIEAYNQALMDANAKVFAAWEEYQELQITWTEAYAEYDALYSLYWNANSVDSQIKNLEDSNKQLLEEIADAEKLLTQYEGYEMPYEVAIELQKQWIAVKEAIVAVQEVKVEEAKAALDAAMPTEEEEE